MDVTKSFLLIGVYFQLMHVSTGNRKKRWLTYTTGTQYGIYVGLSKPLEGMLENVFLGTYFEANYYTVDNSSYWNALIYAGSEVSARRDETGKSVLNGRFSRRHIYDLIESWLKGLGFGDKTCLLRAICDNSANHFHHNGLLGNIIHILLSPSSTAEEADISDDFYKAEQVGRQFGCASYSCQCKFSIVDKFSRLIT